MKMSFIGVRNLGVALAVIAAIIFMTTKTERSVTAATVVANPMTDKWTGPFGGLPPFDKVKVADFKPALEAAMEENLFEVVGIANQSAAPTFENTIAAMELTGQTLARVSTIYGVWGSSMSNDEFSKVETEMDPKLSEHSDKITQNEKLFKRIEAVYKDKNKSKLTAEQQRLTWLYYTNFVRSGAKLDAAKKKRLSEINSTLARHFTKFSQNLLGDETQVFMTLDSEADLAGLPKLSLLELSSTTTYRVARSAPRPKSACPT